MFKPAINAVAKLASLKLSFAGIVALLSGILVSYFNQNQSVLWMALPLLVLAINLLAAIVHNPRIRKNSGLLMFHLCLLALSLFAALGQLTSMKARIEIMQGQVFDRELVTVVRQGPWHDLDKLSHIDFVQGSIRVAYAANLRRGETRSQLILKDGDVVVGDNTAFNDSGYRFYTTSNKGYATILAWHAGEDPVIQGAVHFPSFPLYDWKQENQWQTPAGQALKLTLTGHQKVDPGKDWLLDSRNAVGELTVISAEGVQQVLSVGQRIQLQGGQLEFVAVRMWMGYSIFYNPWLAWFFAVSIVGVFGLAWHYYLKLATNSTLNLEAGPLAKEGRNSAFI